jgi:SEC-C motif-containing protein
LPKTAELLMRSRYAAYALNLPMYIIETTHPASSQYLEDHVKWAEQISAFSLNTQFVKLEVLAAQEKGDAAIVTFVAHLMQHDQNATFTEKSFFERLQGKWFYSGGMAEGHQPTL